MRPSRWAQYCAAVAEMTGLTAQYVWEDLPLAVGKQYEAVFYIKWRVKCLTTDRVVEMNKPGLQRTL